MAGMDGKYDSVLMGILSNEGEISNFLDAVLGFLYRRTDYFRLLKGKEDKIGFPPGVAAKILLKEYQKYEQLARRDDSEREKVKASSQSTIAKPAVTTAPGDKQSTSTPVLETVQPEATSSGTETDSTSAPTATFTSTASHSEDVKVSSTNQEENAEEDMDTAETRQQQQFQSNSISYNGAVRDRYAWSQSITDVDIRVFVPQHIKKGKQVEVTIEKKHLCVRFKNDKGVVQTVIDEDFTWDVNKEECMWTLAPGEHVHVNLEKREERWWEAALVGEPKINVRKIDCSRPMTDLDDEAQAKIGEMMYNEQQKRLGLPQSHEQKTHEMLRKAWDAEGSPFKGQPFDPSVIKVDGGGIVSMKDNKS